MGMDPEGRIHAGIFRVVCVEERMSVVGDANGDGPVSLHLLNEEFLHYVPLLRRQDRIITPAAVEAN